MWQVQLGHCIYTSPSGYKVYQNLWYRWLTLGSSALQTVINRRKPYKPVLHYLPALTLMARHTPGSCCLLGLGGGGVAHMLPHLESIKAVELSDEVIDIAKQFFMVNTLSNVSIIRDNALSYLQHSDELFKHILVDLYDANHFPLECAHDEFFLACKNRLADGGFVAFNLANLQDQLPLLQHIKKHFEPTFVIPVRKCANVVVIATKSEDKKFLIDRIKGSGEVDTIEWVLDWGFVGELV